MIGTIIPKPVTNQEQFHSIMKWCCNPSNEARLMEYHDKYEVIAKPAEEPQQEIEYTEPMDIEKRINEIEERISEFEDALIEVAALLPN